jgi:type III secretion protein Q
MLMPEVPAPASGLRVSPLRLRRRTSAQARAANRVLQRAQALDLQLDGRHWQLSLLPAGGSQSDAGPGSHPEHSKVHVWYVTARWGDAPFVLALHAAAVQAWLSDAFPDLDLPDLPAPFLAAVLETTARTVLAQLADLGQGELQGMRIETSPAVTHGQEETWRLQLKSEVAQLEGTLFTTTAGLMRLASALKDHPPFLGPLADLAAARFLPIALHAQIGFTSLRAEEWAQLKPGDAILVERPLLAPNGEFTLAWGSFAFRARPQAGQLLVTAIHAHTGGAMDRFDDGQDGLSPLDSLRRVPLRVTFDVGELRLTLADLESLQVGQALDLGRPLSEAVQLRINGARVGLGELVDIDGRLGVVLRSLSAQDLAELAELAKLAEGPGAGLDDATASGASDWDAGAPHRPVDDDFAEDDEPLVEAPALPPAEA